MSTAVLVTTFPTQSIRTWPAPASELPSVTSRADASHAELPAPPPPAESAQLKPLHWWPALPPRIPAPPPPPVPRALPSVLLDALSPPARPEAAKLPPEPFAVPGVEPPEP